MLGALIIVSGIIPKSDFLVDMVNIFKHKFATKPEVVEGNVKALKRSMQEVQGL
jgi:pyruvate ferredoxin oxidoreductase gamma subunit